MNRALQAGYKLTEVGVIPEDWETRYLKQLTLDMLQGVNTAIDRPEYVLDGIPMLKANNVIDGEVVFDGADHISLKTFSSYSDRFRLKKNDFLFSNIGARLGTGSLLKQDIECSFAWNVMRIIPDVRKVTPEYLNFLINSPKSSQEIRNQQSGSGMGFVPKGVMQSLLFALPNRLDEQRAIATALSDVDALLAKLDALIAKKRDLKVAAMQQLLTGQTRLPGFSGEWEVKRLGDVASATKGTQLHKSESDGSGLFAHLNGGITPSGFTSFSNTPRQTIAISEGGNSCGFVQFMNEPYWCGGHCYSIVPNRIEKGFLYHALKGRQTDIMGLRVGSGLPNVQKTALLNFSVSCPLDRSEQTAIATILSDMDTELNALEARRDKTRAIKQGMMQVLLTGHIRLV